VISRLLFLKNHFNSKQVPKFFLFGIFTISLFFTISITNQQVFAQSSYYIFIPQGTSVPGCEEIGDCYDPSYVSVPVDTTVGWINDDDAIHTVTSGIPDSGPDGLFDSGSLYTGEEYALIFDKPGFYPYFCMLHPWMEGIIEVEDFGGGFVDLTWDGSFFGIYDMSARPIVPAVGEEFQLRLNIDNIGDIDSPSVEYAIDIYDEGGDLVFTEERTIGSILANNGASIAWYPTLNSPGEHTAEFYLDYNDYIFESNENNNFYEAQIFVQGVNRLFPPDLYFDRIQYTVGMDMEITVIDDVANKNPNAIDEVEVGLEFVPTGDISWGTVPETGRDTAIFSFTTIAPEVPYDADIRIWYPYEVGDGSTASLTDTAFVYAAGGYTTAALQTDKSSYILETDAIITLIEPDEDVSSSVDLINANNIWVQYKGKNTTILDPAFDASDSWLRETDRQTGIFQIIVKIPKQIGSTIVQDGDIIEFSYIDTTTGSGSAETASVKISVIDLSQPPPHPPFGTDVIIPQGTSVPGCEDTNSCYDPFIFFANVGDTVKWFNADSAAHTVTSGDPDNGHDGKFDSSIIMSGDSFSHKFTQKGKYPYFCMMHPWMVGQVVVSDTKQPSDTTPPKILTQDIVEQTTSTGKTINYASTVKAIDNVDGVINTKCSPQSGSFFKVGTTTVSCSATDSSGNTAKKSFTVTVQSSDTAVPAWVKSVAGWYCTGEVDENSFIEGIQYLIDTDIISVSNVQSGAGTGQSIPQWVKNNACWWSQGLINDQDFLNGIEYLISIGVVRV